MGRLRRCRPYVAKRQAGFARSGVSRTGFPGRQRRRAVGILLTGMSADGPKGLLNMREAGTVTIAQDKRSSVVYGMLKVAVELGAAQHNAVIQ